MSAEMKKALYGEVLSLKAYYEILKKMKSEKEMSHILKIIEDNHASISFWKKQLKLHNTTNIYNLSEWRDVEKFSERAASSVNRERVGSSLLQTEEIKLDNYKRLARSQMLDPRLRNALEQNLIPKNRNHKVLIKTLFKGKDR